MMTWFKFLFVSSLCLLPSCQFVDKAISSAANKTGATIGEGIGNAMVRQWTPQFTAQYSRVLFSYAFDSGGMAIHDTDYEPGQWTKWRQVGRQQQNEGTMEKAFLKRDEEGKEWWRIRYDSGQEDGVIIMEGFFDANRGRLLRLRAKFPNQEAGDIPVEEGTLYTKPRRLTQESLDAANQGETNVTVPAGTFRANHYQYQNAAAHTTTDWYLAQDVPGGIIKYGIESRRDAEVKSEGPSLYHYSFELVDFGNDSITSELGSF